MLLYPINAIIVFFIWFFWTVIYGPIWFVQVIRKTVYYSFQVFGAVANNKEAPSINTLHSYYLSWPYGYIKIAQKVFSKNDNSNGANESTFRDSLWQLFKEYLAFFLFVFLFLLSILLVNRWDRFGWKGVYQGGFVSQLNSSLFTKDTTTAPVNTQNYKQSYRSEKIYNELIKKEIYNNKEYLYLNSSTFRVYKDGLGFSYGDGIQAVMTKSSAELTFPKPQSTCKAEKIAYKKSQEFFKRLYSKKNVRIYPYSCTFTKSFAVCKNIRITSKSNITSSVSLNSYLVKNGLAKKSTEKFC